MDYESQLKSDCAEWHRRLATAIEVGAPGAAEGNAALIAEHLEEGRFAELRELCNMAGDMVSLAIGMSGLLTELQYTGRSPEGSPLASEQMTLLESIGDPTMALGLAFVSFNVWADSGEFGEMLRRSQNMIDLADGDPTKGAGFGFGSPLAIALGWRSNARWWLGRVAGAKTSPRPS